MHNGVRGGVDELGSCARFAGWSEVIDRKPAALLMGNHRSLAERRCLNLKGRSRELRGTIRWQVSADTCAYDLSSVISNNGYFGEACGQVVIDSMLNLLVFDHLSLFSHNILLLLTFQSVTLPFNHIF